jgi:hypothetical protein
MMHTIHRPLETALKTDSTQKSSLSSRPHRSLYDREVLSSQPKPRSLSDCLDPSTAPLQCRLHDCQCDRQVHHSRMSQNGKRYGYPRSLHRQSACQALNHLRKQHTKIIFVLPFQPYLQIVILRNDGAELLQQVIALLVVQLINVLRKRTQSKNTLPASDWISSHDRMNSLQLPPNILRAISRRSSPCQGWLRPREGIHRQQMWQ